VNEFKKFLLSQREKYYLIVVQQALKIVFQFHCLLKEVLFCICKPMQWDYCFIAKVYRSIRFDGSLFKTLNEV